MPTNGKATSAIFEPRVARAGERAKSSSSLALGIARSSLALPSTLLAARGFAARISHSLLRRSSGRDFRAKERLLAVYPKYSVNITSYDVFFGEFLGQKPSSCRSFLWYRHTTIGATSGQM